MMHKMATITAIKMTATKLVRVYLWNYLFQKIFNSCQRDIA